MGLVSSGDGGAFADAGGLGAGLGARGREPGAADAPSLAQRAVRRLEEPRWFPYVRCHPGGNGPPRAARDPRERSPSGFARDGHVRVRAGGVRARELARATRSFRQVDPRETHHVSLSVSCGRRPLCPLRARRRVRRRRRRRGRGRQRGPRRRGRLGRQRRFGPGRLRRIGHGGRRWLGYGGRGGLGRGSLGRSGRRHEQRSRSGALRPGEGHLQPDDRQPVLPAADRQDLDVRGRRRWRQARPQDHRAR